ncbi:unnamed protein product [Thelazia callipaeda]|uniref:G_PROTEIN_RECEP_F1_2 domain-containing protein n=1 Tax=Thelazia callipaeda TaxID=103827 RepID=A0A0N5CKV1_THECL|nr:unnamed protein product [Thelazia callipaeda]
MATIGGLLTVLIMACIVGNLFVIIAILTERDLKARPQYYLIFSLAVADLFVGLIVTPLGAWSTILHAWTLGVALCDFWISVDVLLCTSSILHLVAIAIDRYWSVTDVCYVQNRTPRRIFCMLGTIWLISLLISLAPVLGWKDNDFYHRVIDHHLCLISQQISYQVFSTATAFYIPLCAIICIYYKIMRAAKRRFKRERDRRRITTDNHNHLEQNIHSHDEKCFPPPTLETGHNQVVYSSLINAKTTMSRERPKITDVSNSSNTEMETLKNKIVVNYNTSKRQKKNVFTKIECKLHVKENADTKRERKAWRTLVIITGTFVACWLPFFLISLYRPICHCKIPILLESITNWLGYLNSALNPIIYTVFSRDFRASFKRILRRLLFL